MWCRKRIDIGWSDLAVGLLSCFTRFRPDPIQQSISEKFSDGERAVLPCFSVRSGWDAILGELRLPPGSEVLMSALTIPDMTRIVREHGLVPVPLDLEPDTAFPAPDTLRQTITPRTKILLVAHLFGSREDLEPLLEIAREHQLILVEDCAQAYSGNTFAGHPGADISMFSFGTIKTRTALGGAVLHFRDQELFQRVMTRQANYPVQPRGQYFQRILKYGVLKAVSGYWAFRGLVGFCRWRNINYHELLNRTVKGFGGDWNIEQFRQQPSTPLLAVMDRRIQQDCSRQLTRQSALGNRLRDAISGFAETPGTDTDHHHYWVFAVLTDHPELLIETLAHEGFDGTQGVSMHVIPRPDRRIECDPRVAKDLLREMVYVPMYQQLPEKEVDRLAKSLRQFFEKHPSQESAMDSNHLLEVEPTVD